MKYAPSIGKMSSRIIGNVKLLFIEISYGAHA